MSVNGTKLCRSGRLERLTLPPGCAVAEDD